MTTKQEVFISVDVETAGPIPGEYSMLTLGQHRATSTSFCITCSNSLKIIAGRILKSLSKACKYMPMSLALGIYQIFHLRHFLKKPVMGWFVQVHS